MTLRFEDYDRLCHKIAHKETNRLNAQGVRAEYEDVYQDVCLTWIKAAEKFEPDRGFRFSTYLTTAAQNNLRRSWKNRVVEPKSVSFDHPASEHGRTLAETLPDDQDTADIGVEQRQLAEEKLSMLSPLTRRIVEIIYDPPEIIRQEVRAFKARQRHAVELGITKFVQGGDLSVQFMMDLLRVPPHQRRAIRDELKRVVA